MLIKLYIDIRKYQEKIVKITELPFANRSTFVQTKVFTESDLEFAFRFYPNYNSRNSGHSSLSLFQFEGSPAKLCLYYEFGSEKTGNVLDVKLKTII
jgi:hypothetical protein